MSSYLSSSRAAAEGSQQILFIKLKLGWKTRAVLELEFLKTRMNLQEPFNIMRMFKTRTL